MYLLDTNIVSMLDPRRHVHAPDLVRWLRRNDNLLFLSAVTLAEMQAGVLKLRREKKDARADELEKLIDSIEQGFGERILPVDGMVARRLAHIGDRIFPRNMAWPDLVIAATAEVNRLILLTHNIRHFEPSAVQTIDPLTQLPPDPT